MKRSREDQLLLPKDYLSRHTPEFGKAVRFILDKDPSLADIILKSDFPIYSINRKKINTLNECFVNLASGILSQQISGVAAKAIKARIVDLFKGEFPSYETLESIFKSKETEDIRKCGVSGRKLVYLESLVNYFCNESENIERLIKEGNAEEIVNELVKNVKGIGLWSAKMFLVTALQHPNVFTADDLGISRGCSNYLKTRPEVLKNIMTKRRKIKKSKIKHKNRNWTIYDEDIVEICAESFEPYRTVFMLILWRLSSTNMEAMIAAEKQFDDTKCDK
ncbi:DNA-3-methyladenine glycosylase II Ecym_6188 [Eremothecium cymbalariae DBVPG|uniref:HhH-GPD domain-containing protein n=1 Tax=Eremothecium cymbalariae (strain CBS 270.75 / DBVPG 7215 / KCTC 17166 / NRRL Y-17582) TaxID=931890 RepID=G8JV92_ERECY|nr:hypothetical protein Ecym_6188 [Eremothecium cymbalariae DBVPG\